MKTTDIQFTPKMMTSSHTWCCLTGLGLHHLVPGVPEDPVDGGHGGDGGWVTHPVGQQLLPDLPGEQAGAVCLDADDPLHHRGCGHLLQ